jgi:hypothetical protein
MGTNLSKYDDKDDEEFLNVDFLSLYNDDYLFAVEDKISGGTTLPSYEDEIQKADQAPGAKAEDPVDSYQGTLKSLATIFTSKFSRVVKVEDFACFNDAEQKTTLFEYMRGRRYLLLDRIFKVRSTSSFTNHLKRFLFIVRLIRMFLQINDL